MGEHSLERSTLVSNGLKLIVIKSNAKPVEVDNIFKLTQQHFNSSAYLVAYLDYKVLIGLYHPKKRQMIFADGETLESKYIQKLRVFDSSKELLIWRSKDRLKGRIRIDGEGEEIEVVEANQVLWGTRLVDIRNNFAEITEDRGTTLILPITNLDIDNHIKRIFIKTRNYIGYTPNYQATYIDCRFVGFSFKDIGGKDEPR